VALRGYIGAVWPDFDWPKAYEAFLTEYARVASPDAFEATTQLELAARCMIETGTTSLYQTLLGYAQEPVLRQVLKHIRDDEVDHYKYFLRFFSRRTSACRTKSDSRGVGDREAGTGIPLGRCAHCVSPCVRDEPSRTPLHGRGF